MEAKSRVCRICGRAFANGKAMGGHMRSHLAKLPLPPPMPRPEPPQSPMTIQSANSELSFIAIAARDNREGEAESRRTIANPDKASLQPRPPKRDRHSVDDEQLPLPVDGAEHISSVSSDVALSDKDAAHCLLLLSVDNNVAARDDSVLAKKVAASVEMIDEIDSDEEEDDDDDDDDEKDESFCVELERTRARPRFKCKVCKKIFGSYQALARHRASHDHGEGPAETNRVSHRWRGSSSGEASQCDPEDNPRIFECPFCDKVFESGQGLGGHKKIHCFNAPKKKKSSNDDSDDTAEESKPVKFFIDLNLPPPPEDDDDNEKEIVRAQLPPPPTNV